MILQSNDIDIYSTDNEDKLVVAKICTKTFFKIEFINK